MKTKTKWIKDVHKLDVVKEIRWMAEKLSAAKKARGYKYIVGTRSYNSMSCSDKGIYLEYPVHEK